MPMKSLKILFITFIVFSFYSCEKEITVDLPEVEQRIVIEGTIEQSQPPLVLLTYSQGYFEPTDVSSLESFFVRGAKVTLTDGTTTDSLFEICSSELSPQELEAIAGLIGFTPEQLSTFNICAYTTLNQNLWGQEGKTYTLKVEKDEHLLTASTKINTIVELDSLWFAIPNEENDDSLGFVYGILSDPDTTGNAYRWFAKRINSYPSWAPDGLAGQQKDPVYIAPLGSVFDDTFFNGLSFEFGYYRGTGPNPSKFDDLNEERGFYKKGDTIAVKGCVIDRQAFRFIDSYENQISSQGSPFSVPYNLETNVTGGLGAFIGYGAVYDTVICQ